MPEMAPKTMRVGRGVVVAVVVAAFLVRKDVSLVLLDGTETVAAGAKAIEVARVEFFPPPFSSWDGALLFMAWHETSL